MTNKLMATVAAVALFTVAFNSLAEAKPKHHHRSHHATKPFVLSQQVITCNMQGCSDNTTTHSAKVAAERNSDIVYEGRIVGGRPSGCPHAYCGCGTSLKVFGRIIPELNLAINWVRKFPRTSPAPGMVAARSGHVFYIESVIDSETVLAFDSNSGGHKTRIHAVSLRGYHIVDPHGAKLAQLN